MHSVSHSWRRARFVWFYVHIHVRERQLPVTFDIYNNIWPQVQTQVLLCNIYELGNGR